MEKGNNLQRQQQEMNISSSIIQVTKTSDLLQCKPITAQILKHGRSQVNLVVAASVNRCLEGLDIDLPNDKIQLLIEDIVDVFKFDSIEDIQICLKNGRQGKYGKTYGKLNMIIIQEWMAQHLDRKAQAREAQYNKAKHDFKTREEYETAVKVGAKINQEQQERKKAERYDQISYEEYKANYEEDSKARGVNPNGTIES
jgi:hypothetical protein